MFSINKALGTASFFKSQWQLEAFSILPDQLANANFVLQQVRPFTPQKLLRAAPVTSAQDACRCHTGSRFLAKWNTPPRKKKNWGYRRFFSFDENWPAHQMKERKAFMHTSKLQSNQRSIHTESQKLGLEGTSVLGRDHLSNPPAKAGSLRVGSTGRY